MEAKVKVDQFKAKEINQKLVKTTFNSFQHAVATIRIIARRSIKRSKKASRPGTPPHTQTGLLKSSLVYYVDKQKLYAVVGPSADTIGKIGEVHEFGGNYKKGNYPARPFMAPAFNMVLPTLPTKWAKAFRSS